MVTDDKDKQGFSTRLNAVLDRANIDKVGAGRQRVLAKKFSVSGNGARKWIRGEAVPRYEIILQIVKEFKHTGVTAEWLLSGNPDYAPSWASGQETDNAIKSEGATYSNAAAFKHSADTQIIRIPAVSWAEYCDNTNSINKIKELDFMMIDNGIDVPKEAYAIDIDTHTFGKFPIGTRLLIDPNKKPEKDNTVILSIDDGIPTLAHWKPGLGSLHIEPIESGYPNSISLEGKRYTIHGVAIWQHQKGGRL